MDKYLRLLGKRVKDLREETLGAQPVLAGELKRYGISMTQAGIGHIETGARLPSPAVLIGLSLVFDVSTDYLLGVIDDPSPSVGRTVSPEQIRLEMAFRRLSAGRQAELVIIANALAEAEEKPPTDAYEIALEAALDAVKALGGDEEVVRLLQVLDSTAPTFTRRYGRRQECLDK